MSVLRRLLLGLGIIIAAFGALFTLQGMGVVHWPATSPMLGKGVWVGRGLGTLVIGLGLVLLARRSVRQR